MTLSSVSTLWLTPSYDGSSTVYALPIEGMADYYNSQQYLYKLLAERRP